MNSHHWSCLIPTGAGTEATLAHCYSRGQPSDDLQCIYYSRNSSLGYSRARDPRLPALNVVHGDSGSKAPCYSWDSGSGPLPYISFMGQWFQSPLAKYYSRTAVLSSYSKDYSRDSRPRPLRYILFMEQRSETQLIHTGNIHNIFTPDSRRYMLFTGCSASRSHGVYNAPDGG